MSLTGGNDDKIIAELVALLSTKWAYRAFIVSVHATVWHKHWPPYWKALHCSDKNIHWPSTGHWNDLRTSASPLLYLLTSTVYWLKFTIKFVPQEMPHTWRCGNWQQTWLFSHSLTAQLGLALLCEVPRLHSDTPYSTVFLWMTDRPDAETTTWLHATLTRGRYSNPHSQEASGHRGIS
jgi:hypothetical protein